MKRGFFKVSGSRHKFLIPSDAAALGVLDGYKIGDVIRVQVSKPRNPKHHAKYWALLKLVHDGTAVQDIYPTVNKLHHAIKGALGYFSEVKLPDGKIFHVVDSIAYESMDQQAFEEFYGKVLDLITTQIVPNLDRENLVREVEAMTK